MPSFPSLPYRKLESFVRREGGGQQESKSRAQFVAPTTVDRGRDRPRGKRAPKGGRIEWKASGGGERAAIVPKLPCKLSAENE